MPSCSEPEREFLDFLKKEFDSYYREGEDEFIDKHDALEYFADDFDLLDYREEFLKLLQHYANVT